MVITGNEEFEEHIIFVHKTEYKSKLIWRYGNNVCLLDANYKTNKYSVEVCGNSVEIGLPW